MAAKKRTSQALEIMRRQWPIYEREARLRFVRTHPIELSVGDVGNQIENICHSIRGGEEWAIFTHVESLPGIRAKEIRAPLHLKTTVVNSLAGDVQLDA